MSRKKILIIEDEQDLAELLQARLEASDFDVTCAFDGEAGLEQARKEQPDLILLDVVMPKLNGYQVCRELKRSAETKSIPIILLTAKAQESDKFWGKETGADAYLTKPCEFDMLLKKIRDLLGEKV